MSSATLTNLRDYLYGTLSPANMIWLAAQLTEYADKQVYSEILKRYTMEEINAILDEAEADFAARRTIPHEESMRRWKAKLAHKKQQELEMAEAI